MKKKDQFLLLGRVTCIFVNLLQHFVEFVCHKYLWTMILFSNVAFKSENKRYEVRFLNTNYQLIARTKIDLIEYQDKMVSYFEESDDNEFNQQIIINQSNLRIDFPSEFSSIL